MANKQKCPKKFGLAGGKHGSKRKALGYGRKNINIQFERISIINRLSG